MSILWVTSFNDELYDASGKNLIESFYNYKIEGELYIGFECKSFKNICKQHSGLPVNQIVGYNITDHILLKEFLSANKDVIPKSLGGEALPCKCRSTWSKSDKMHIKYCPHTWFKRNAFRWFRKYVTLVEAFKYAQDRNFDYIIWIDCDCIFKKPISYYFISNLFENSKIDLIYLKGPKRRILEAGFVAYNNKTKVLFPTNFLRVNGACTTGKFILSNVLSKYSNKEFRLYDRWDDCYILQKVIKNLETKRLIITKDIGKDISGGHSDIFTKSVIGPYIKHNKGTHGRKLGIMK